MLGFPAVAEFAGTERPEDWGSIYLGDTFMQVRGDRASHFPRARGKAGCGLISQVLRVPSTS